MDLNHPDIPRKPSGVWLKLEDGEVTPVNQFQMQVLAGQLKGKKEFSEIQDRKLFRMWRNDMSCITFIQLFDGEDARDDLSLMELF
jgi:hypothetical protein